MGADLFADPEQPAAFIAWAAKDPNSALHSDYKSLKAGLKTTKFMRKFTMLPVRTTWKSILPTDAQITEPQSTSKTVISALI